MDTHTPRQVRATLALFAFLCLSFQTNAQPTQTQDLGRFNFQDTVKPLGLRDALQQGLRDNHNQRLRNHDNRLLDIQWDGAWESFWLPTVNLTMTTGDQRITRLDDGDKRITQQTLPDGSVVLDLGEYTVFNWGKDYLAYLNEKQNFRRGKQRLVEGRRSLRHAIIIKYFEVTTRKEIEKIRRDQLRYSSFIYRLNRERVKTKKLSQQDYYQARAEYLLAQQKYQEAKRELNLASEQLAYLLDDPVGTKYITKENLEYKKLHTNLKDIALLTDKNAPGILESKTSFDVAWRDHEIARRNNMLLPTFKLDFGVYSQAFGRNTFGGAYATFNGGNNFEIVASLNASWTLMGEEGIFNMRTLDQSLINRAKANREYLKQTDLAQSNVRRTFEQVLVYEKELQVLQMRSANSRKTYDVVMDNYTRGKTTFVNFLHALRDLAEAEVDLADRKWQHLQQKVLLASYAGMEEFPGENFEELAARIPKVDDLLRDDVLENIPNMKEAEDN